MSDRLLGGFLIVLAVAFIAAASQIESQMIFDALGPKAFPILVAVVLATASLVPVLKPDPEPEWPDTNRRLEIIFAILVMVAYALSLEELGFLIATAVASAVLSWRLGATVLWCVPIGVSIAVVIYTVFQLILGLSLAKGPLGF